MKIITNISLFLATVALASSPLSSVAAEGSKKPEVKPYKLETCAVSDEKLGSMGKPFVFEHKGQEIKLCCKSCRKDFDKNPDKFLKKMAENEKKERRFVEKLEKGDTAGIDLGESYHGTPVVANGTLYIATRSKLMAIRGK